MGVTSSVTLETTKTVVKTVEDQTIEGYESAYSCYFNEATQAPEEPTEPQARTRDSLDDPKDCTD